MRPASLIGIFGLQATPWPLGVSAEQRSDGGPLASFSPAKDVVIPRRPLRDPPALAVWVVEESQRASPRPCSFPSLPSGCRSWDCLWLAPALRVPAHHNPGYRWAQLKVQATITRRAPMILDTSIDTPSPNAWDHPSNHRTLHWTALFHISSFQHSSRMT